MIDVIPCAHPRIRIPKNQLTSFQFDILGIFYHLKMTAKYLALLEWFGGWVKCKQGKCKWNVWQQRRRQQNQHQNPQQPPPPAKNQPNQHH